MHRYQPGPIQEILARRALERPVPEGLPPVSQEVASMLNQLEGLTFSLTKFDSALASMPNGPLRTLLFETKQSLDLRGKTAMGCSEFMDAAQGIVEFVLEGKRNGDKLGNDEQQILRLEGSDTLYDWYYALEDTPANWQRQAADFLLRLNSGM